MSHRNIFIETFSDFFQTMVCSIGKPYTTLQQYAEENFSTKDRTVSNSRWVGMGSRQLGLGLFDRVTPNEYHNLFLGKDKEGNSLKQQQRNKNNRAGRDLTFSAPKSVSLLCLVEEQKEIFTVHDRAVDRVLSYIEGNCIFTRMGKAGRNRQQTDNLIGAVFQHHHSRNLDPNLHSHCVIFNLTQGRDFKWRTMENSQLYEQMMTLGMIYRHSLSQQLQESGYALNWNQDGTFEVTGFSAEQIKHFSSRRTELINFTGIKSSSLDRARACVATRSQKKYMTVAERTKTKNAWKTQLYTLNHSPDKIEREKFTEERNNRARFDTSLIENSVKTISTRDRKTKFYEHELLREILLQAKGNFNLDRIQQEIKNHQSLITTKEGKLTTIDLLQEEKHNYSTTSDRSEIIEEVKNIFSAEQGETSTKDLTYTPNGNTHKRFRLVEPSEQQNWLDQLTQKYSGKALSNSITLLTDTENEQREFTKQIRQKLIREEKLSNKAIVTVALEPKKLSKDEKLNPENYQIGDAIKFGRNSKNLKSDRIYKVIEVNSTNKTLTLIDRQNNETTFPLNRYRNRQIFKVTKRELRENELLRFACAQYVNGNRFSAGQLFTIKKIRDESRISIGITGKQFSVNADKLFFTEYGYAATLEKYTSQGRQKTIKDCTYCPSDSKTEELFRQDLLKVASLTKNSLTVCVGNNYLCQTPARFPKLNLGALGVAHSASTIRDREEFKMDDSTRDNELFEIASSAKHLSSKNSQDVNKQVLTLDESTTIKQSKEGLSIVSDGKKIQFDRDLKVEKNELSDKEIKDLSKKIKIRKNKEKTIQENRTKEINKNVGLSL
jgi:conjugative relaxase-like TrwC/TraI family protein